VEPFDLEVRHLPPLVPNFLPEAGYPSTNPEEDFKGYLRPRDHLQRFGIAVNRTAP
jgi:hypothetical protein